MTALQIDDILNFMKHLLVADSFDTFLLVQGSVTTYNTFDIDGLIRPDFFGSDLDVSPLNGYKYTPWKHTKELVYSLIKGKHTPLSFKFVFHADDLLKKEILTNTSSNFNETTDFVLTLKYDGQKLSAVSGISTNTFTTDRSADESWDKWVTSFIQGMQ